MLPVTILVALHIVMIWFITVIRALKNLMVAASVLWNPKIHCRFRKAHPLNCILRQMNSMHIFMPYFLKIPHHYSWAFCLELWSFVCISQFSHTCFVSRPSHRIIQGELNEQWTTSLCNVFQSLRCLLCASEAEVRYKKVSSWAS